MVLPEKKKGLGQGVVTEASSESCCPLQAARRSATDMNYPLAPGVVPRGPVSEPKLTTAMVDV